MENVSKALLMAAGVLLAILIIAIALLLFRSGANVVETYQNSNEENELNMFNSNFTRMLSGNDTNLGHPSNTITVYDIITVANFAWNNNVKFVGNPLSSEYQGDPRLLRINLCDADSNVIISDLQNYNQLAYDILLQYGYFQDMGPTAVAYEPVVIYYTIDIAKYNNAGRVQVINFKLKPQGSASIQHLNTTNLTTAASKMSEARYKRTVN